ncbi:MAG: hypothetical protein PWQ55_486 [Chloroflexota bacterium]|nr:hypothetical protein [Chloroflexota bacterium]
MKSINCKNCGAPLSIENYKRSVICPYCKSENILSYPKEDGANSGITVRVVQVNNPSPMDDDIDQLERLHNLYVKGALTEEEFLEKKEELLEEDAGENRRFNINLNNSPVEPVSNRSKWITFLICLYSGFFGGHRFFTGHIKLGILYLFTGGLFCVGWVFDLIQILTGTYVDKNGRKLNNNSKKMPVWVIIPTAFFLLIFIAAILPFQSDTDSTPLTDPTPSSSAMGTAIVTETALEEVVPQDAIIAAEPFELSGESPNVFDIDKWDGAALVHIQYQGTGNFIADTLDGSNNSTANGLVNEIGAFEGWQIIDEDSTSTRLEVTNASGSYSFNFYPLSEEYSGQMEVPGLYINHIPVVVYLSGENPDTLEVNFSGDGNFIVDTVDGDGISTSNGLINEIGPFSGKFVIPNGTKYIYVKMANGDYTFNLSGKE